MSRTDTRDIQLQDNEGNTKPGNVESTLFDSADRLKRAVVRLFAFWAAAFVAIFIPLAHFVLVPAFLITGIVMAIGAYRTQQAMNGAQGVCPVCQDDINIVLEASDQLPKWTYCPDCNAPLQLIPTDHGTSS